MFWQTGLKQALRVLTNPGMPRGSDALEAYLLDGECVKKWAAGAVSQVSARPRDLRAVAVLARMLCSRL